MHDLKNVTQCGNNVVIHAASALSVKYAYISAYICAGKFLNIITTSNRLFTSWLVIKC